MSLNVRNRDLLGYFSICACRESFALCSFFFFIFVHLVRFGSFDVDNAGLKRLNAQQLAN